MLKNYAPAAYELVKRQGVIKLALGIDNTGKPDFEKVIAQVEVIALNIVLGIRKGTLADSQASTNAVVVAIAGGAPSLAQLVHCHATMRACVAGGSATMALQFA